MGSLNVSSCEEILLLAGHQTSGSMASNLIHVILPQICSVIDNIPSVNLTHCCDPIPSMVLNRTVFPMNDTDPTKLIGDMCSYIESQNNTHSEPLYKELCMYGDTITTGVMHTAYRLLTLIILLLLSPIGFFANALILLTVYKVKHLRNTTGYFICNLAIADLLVIVVMILFVTTFGSGSISVQNPRVTEFLFLTLEAVIGSASLLHVTVVTIERGIAVSMPLRYTRYLNERTANKMIAGIWIYCLILLVMGLLRIPIVSEAYSDVFFFVAATLSFFIPCILVIVSYSFIIVTALKSMKIERKISSVLAVISDQENLEKVKSMRPARFREIKIAFNVAIMTVPFVCGWGYFMACTIYEIVADDDITGFQNWLIPFVPFVISCLNPLTYLMFTRSLRKSSLMLLSRSKLCKKLTQSLIRRESEVTSISFVINDRSNSCVDDLASRRQSENNILDTTVRTNNIDTYSNETEQLL